MGNLWNFPGHSCYCLMTGLSPISIDWLYPIVWSSHHSPICYCPHSGSAEGLVYSKWSTLPSLCPCLNRTILASAARGAREPPVFADFFWCNDLGWSMPHTLKHTDYTYLDLPSTVTKTSWPIWHLFGISTFFLNWYLEGLNNCIILHLIAVLHAVYIHICNNVCNES